LWNLESNSFYDLTKAIMIVYFNNCRRYNHGEVYGGTAFFDLGTEGAQAKMAQDLRPGDKCVVASYDDDREWVLFKWYKLTGEKLVRSRNKDSGSTRVFFGKLLRTVRVRKSKAVNLRQYKAFFNCKHHFKRPSVIKV
jgi:hypothetical protein